MPLEKISTSSPRARKEYSISFSIVGKKWKKVEIVLNWERARKYREAIAYMENDTNARTIWEKLGENTRKHIASLIWRAVSKGEDCQIYMLYGAIENMRNSWEDILKINSLWTLYTKSSQLNNERDNQKQRIKYYNDSISYFSWLLKEKTVTERENFLRSLSDTIKNNKGSNLSMIIHRMLQEIWIPIPKDTKDQYLVFGDTFFRGFDTSKPTTYIWEFKLDYLHCMIFSLNNKLEMQKESKILEHCVWNSDFYLKKVEQWLIKIFSLRTPDGIPKWTIEYDIANGIIRQFRGQSNKQATISQEDKELVACTLTTLRRSWYAINKISEKFSYCLVWNPMLQEYTSSSPQELKDICLQDQSPHVLKGWLKLDKDETLVNINRLSGIPWLTLNMTHVAKDIKNNIALIKWNLIDYSRVVSYENLLEVGGYINCEEISRASWLIVLKKIGGSTYFTKLTRAERKLIPALWNRHKRP